MCSWCWGSVAFWHLFVLSHIPFAFFFNAHVPVLVPTEWTWATGGLVHTWGLPCVASIYYQQTSTCSFEHFQACTSHFVSTFPFNNWAQANLMSCSVSKTKWSLVNPFHKQRFVALFIHLCTCICNCKYWCACCCCLISLSCSCLTISVVEY